MRGGCSNVSRRLARWAKLLGSSVESVLPKASSVPLMASADEEEPRGMQQLAVRAEGGTSGGCASEGPDATSSPSMAP